MPVTRSGKSSVAVSSSPPKCSGARKGRNGDKKVASTGAPRCGIRDTAKCEQTKNAMEQQRSSAKVDRSSPMVSTSNRKSDCASAEGDRHEANVAKLASFLQKVNVLIDRATKAYSEANYDLSIQLYTEVMTLFNLSLGIPLSPNDKELRIRVEKSRVILLCGRAACYVETKQYEDAVKDCTAALEIRPNYLKARLCKARSLAILRRFKESEIEYLVWLSAVEHGKARPDSSLTFGSLDELENITDEERQCVQDEWRTVAQASRQQEANRKHYEVLGLTSDATTTDIKKAYHRMALKYHPDKSKDPKTVQIFRQANEARDVLLRAVTPYMCDAII